MTPGTHAAKRIQIALSTPRSGLPVGNPVTYARDLDGKSTVDSTEVNPTHAMFSFGDTVSFTVEDQA